MKILQVDKFFWLFGGAERYMFEVSELLKHRGHDLCYFSMQHPRNFESEYSKYFVSNVEYRGSSVSYKLRTIPKTLGKTIYSFESKRKLSRLLSKERVELSHLHLISHHISPSILHVLREFDIPTVQTCHDYKWVCPAYQLYIHHKNKICERCLGGQYYHIFKHRCLKNSFCISALSGVAAYIHTAIKIVEENIDLFIAPSQFIANKLIQGGIPEKKVRYLHNFLNLNAYEPKYDVGDYAVFVGRLQPEKGIKTLIASMAIARNTPLVVVGEGEQRQELEQYVSAQGVKNVRFVGYKAGEELKNLIRESAFLVVPSECFDICPMVTLEAYALGKPVVASRIGGIPESIDEEETGLLFEPGNASELAEKIQILAGDKKRCEEMGRRGRAKIEQISGEHYDRLMELYKEAGRKH